MARRDESHLVVASIPGGLRVSATVVDYSAAKAQLELLARLSRTLGLRNSYALSINREREGSQILVGFADPADAASLARAVKAEGIGEYPGWVSQRRFVFDEKAALTMAPRSTDRIPSASDVPCR